MDDKESKQLEEIYQDTQNSNTQLGAINERTKNIQKNIEGISEEVQQNREDINELQDTVKRNSTILKGVSGAVSVATGIGIWFADKLSRLRLF